jgi:hypothetical protein
MKLTSRTDTKQTELFYEVELCGVPMTLPLSAHRERELKRVIAELLLSVALGDIEGPKGDECDK